MQPILATLITIDAANKQPLYLQIANRLMALVRDGSLQPGYRLPSTRILAQMLQVHRKTVVQAYNELLAQGWFESRVGSGTFVARHLPETQHQKLVGGTGGPVNPAQKAGFAFTPLAHLQKAVITSTDMLHLDDGFPDARLAPVEELARAYRSQLTKGNRYVRLGYGDNLGSLRLRQALAGYLNETRCLKITYRNIIITRGTIMGLYLACTGFLQPGDKVVAGAPGWSGAEMNFLQAGATVIKVATDEYGLDVDALERICSQQTIRMVYVTSHHHYPTTVSLRADRRLQLLNLASRYGFIVFEDDYDYDFHYLSKPLAPLASADEGGMVLYCGSFTKAVSPAFRVGYLVGSEDAVNHLGLLRRIIDRQGDTMLENAMADLLKTGVIQRHLRKSLRIYRQRRDVLCNLLQQQLGNRINLQMPDGGMAVWANFAPGIDIAALAGKAQAKGLQLAPGKWVNTATGLNAMRLGFASSTPEELERSVDIMAGVMG
jgi:GntR family transcriptional regulator/MocR family aminotransferase